MAEVTAYAGNCPLCETTGVTANGTDVTDRPYGIASSPNLPFGSRVWIPNASGYMASKASRWFIVDDRGGALTAEWKRSGIVRLDLRYKTHWSAQQFGRKLMMVYIQEQQ